MPTRPYSAAIIGGLWPSTSPDAWSDVGDDLAKKADSLDAGASDIRRLADGLPAENSGKTIDAMYEMCHRQAVAVIKQATIYHSMAKGVSEIARLIYSARSRLDEIDERANEEIEQIRQQAQAQARLGSSVAVYAAAKQAIAAVIAQSRAEALGESTKVAGAITSQASKMAGGTAGPQDSGSTPLNPNDFPKGFGGGPGPGLHGMLGNLAQAPPGLGNQPEKPAPTNTMGGTQPTNPAPVDSNRGSEPGSGPGEDDTGTQTGDPAGKGDALPGSGPKHPAPATGMGGREPGTTAQSPQNGVPPMAPPPMGTPSGGSGGGSGVGGLSPLGATRGLSGLSPTSGLSSGAPSTPSMSSGLGGPAAGGVPSVPSGGGGGGGAVPPAASGSDFTRGFNAGFATGPAGASMLPPPVSAAPPSTSGTGASGLPSAPAAPASPAAGASGGAGSAAGGGMPMGAAPMMAAPAAAAAGALPPFGSDVQPRQVAPAAGPPPAAPPPAAPLASASAAAMPPLPPGVAASGVGAAATGAYAGVKSSSDPLLESATQLVYQLTHASLVYGCVDWCVGIFKTPDGLDTVVVSNEGAGYIPPGVFPPRSARMLFSDTGLIREFQARWFGWVNPAQTMLAYASLICDHDPNRELYALAVSTDHGGSAVPARDGGVPHYEDCPLVSSPIRAESEPMPLDELHVHRLQMLDAAEYQRLMRMAIPDSQERDASWATTRDAVQTALNRAGSLLGLEVAPVIRHVTAALQNGEAVSDDQWSDLELARFNATLDSASQRAGRQADEVVSAHARACHNLARVAELLLMWRRGPNYLDIAYEARQIGIEARLWPSNET
jgi:hypothetical protein